MKQSFLVLLRHEKKLLLLFPYAFICFYFYLTLNSYTLFSFLEDSFIFGVFIYPIYLIYHYAITEYYYGTFTQIRMSNRIKKKSRFFYALFTGSTFFIVFYLAGFLIAIYQNRWEKVPIETLFQSLINQWVFYFILSYALLHLKKSWQSKGFKFTLIILFILDFYVFDEWIFKTIGLKPTPNTLDSFGVFSLLYLAFLFFIWLRTAISTVGIPLIERDLRIRKREWRGFFVLFAFLLGLTLYFFSQQSDGSLLRWYLLSFFQGISREGFDAIQQGDFYSFPLIWFCFLLSYLILLSSFRSDDWQLYGQFIRMRISNHLFQKTKNLSLLIWTMFFFLLLIFIPVLIEQTWLIENIFETRQNLLLYLVLFFSHLYLIGLFYEYLSMIFPAFFSLLVTAIGLLILLFTGKGLFIGVTMFNQWITGEQNPWLEGLFLLICYLMLFSSLKIYQTIVKKKGAY